MGAPTASRAVALEVLRHGPIARRGDRAQARPHRSGRCQAEHSADLGRRLLLEVGEPGERRVGRPSRPLDVHDPESNYFIGVKIAGTGVIAVLTDFRASVIERASAPLRGNARVGRGCRGRRDLQLSSQVARVTGVGIGVGGPVPTTAW